MNNFIEVTDVTGITVLQNVNEINAVSDNMIVLIHSGCCIQCKETYEELKAKIMGDEDRHGKWNFINSKPYCSECKEEPYRKSDNELPNYCPNCGAKMETIDKR